MATTLKELVRYCDRELRVEAFRDYCPNGLQVEGRATLRRLACAVTANQSVLDAALAWEADALLVHHGYFWRGEAQEVVGMKRRRLATLLCADMSLLAYHLPLDAHPRLGNNAELGRLLGVEDVAPLDPADDSAVGNIGSWSPPRTLETVLATLGELSGREPLLIGDRARPVSRVAWCTGGAQGYIDRAAAAGAELFISGEISEQTVHSAREQGIAYIAAGHHATERYGVQALARDLAGRFDLEWHFIDCDNPA